MSFKETIIRILFPLKCPLCGELVPVTDEICSCCRGELREISHNYCIHCGADIDKCTCEINNNISERIAGVCYYSGKAKWEIALFKFAGNRKLSVPMSLKMSERAAEVYSDVSFDSVTFVPVSEKSFKQKGFNHSELLAKGVAERLFVPLEAALVKVKETTPQHSLGAKERLGNLSGAFALAEGISVKGKTILLCDDIRTTGTTLKECSDVLYKNGAKMVYCLVYAVTDYMTDF